MCICILSHTGPSSAANSPVSQSGSSEEAPCLLVGEDDDDLTNKQELLGGSDRQKCRPSIVPHAGTKTLSVSWLPAQMVPLLEHFPH